MGVKEREVREGRKRKKGERRGGENTIQMIPGLSFPDFSPEAMRPRAVLSLTDPPGFMNSAFPKIVHPVARDKLARWIRGVAPTVPKIKNMRRNEGEEKPFDLPKIRNNNIKEKVLREDRSSLSVHQRLMS